MRRRSPVPGSVFAPGERPLPPTSDGATATGISALSVSAQQIQANRLDLLSRLAGDISHEIKNPLHAMVINLELVRRKVEKGETAIAIDRVGIVEDEIRKVHALANALLEALRPPRDAQAACGFSTIIEEMMPLVGARARLARVELAAHAASATLVVPVSSQDLRLLFLNLVDRAVRTAGPGGELELHARVAGDEASLEISSGQPLLDAVEHAWLRAPSADAEHIDLGLRVVRDLVENAGGRIDSADRAARARLIVALPRARSA